ncbi:phospholipase B1, membrane-associated-like [Apis laboriosa]|uniref:phospholipase B1, membrane-associated-like n=1 Tax=Apis laboriosa TaxID=183418 RepID=UPI001CC39B37|nr:phospholipase B1, membrane-associated-like [Apis laboriosa]XP_043795820.1 phospholipase B1, membrane-associated-like [Apis laboriosa]
MIKLYMCLLLQICAITAAMNNTFLDTPDNLTLLRLMRTWVLNNFEKGQRLDAQKAGIVQKEFPINVPFPCNVTGGRSPTVPDSVNRLRPGDIDVIAAMGDSITTGAGLLATNTIQLTIENRGMMATIGGEETWRKVLTLPNIFKEFNHNLIGYALGNSLTSHPASQLNVGEGGAVSMDMPYMAKFLINRMKKDPRIDINNHWKFISILIGPNDFCAMCNNPSPSIILKNHKKDLINTLRILRDNLPRSFVAVIISPHIKEIVKARRGRFSWRCYLISTIECPCLLAVQYKERRQEYYEIIDKWQELEEEIVNYPEFHTNNFTVITLPAIKNIKVPLAEDGFADLSYFSIDCFHLSQKCHAILANYIWNNLLEPIGNKSDQISHPKFFKTFLCPTSERPYLMTRENSRNII